jgi:TPR repeat protein
VKPCVHVIWVLSGMLSPALTSAAPAAVASEPSRDLVKAVTHGNCDTAVRLANEDLKANDAQAIFLVGRMVAEGVCVEPDVAAATAYFSHAAADGLSAAQVEYGMQIGLGEGADQSYEHAGDLCQKGGLERPTGGSSLYSLGYVCTLRGLVSRRLRESLPRGAFLRGTGVAQVSFNPASGIMQIRSLPRVASRSDTTTGTFLPQPLFDAQETIDKAWKDAMSAVPKPDTARLDNQSMELTLDLDMTIERGGGSHHDALPMAHGSLMPGDVRLEMGNPH